VLLSSPVWSCSPASVRLGLGSTYFAFVAPVVLPSDVSLRFPQWHHSIHKLHLFGFIRYHRLLLIDADVVLVHSLDEYFAPTTDIAAVRDQWYHCARADKMNGGTLSFRPSGSLLQAALWTLGHRPTCMEDGKELIEADQSVMNCMCGMGGQGYKPVNQVHDITVRRAARAWCVRAPCFDVAAAAAAADLPLPSSAIVCPLLVLAAAESHGVVQWCGRSGELGVDHVSAVCRT
jgi:hypothetical protein